MMDILDGRLSAYQHGTVAVLLPLLGFVLLLFFFVSPVVPSEYAAVASFVLLGALIPSGVLYVLNVYFSDEG